MQCYNTNIHTRALRRGGKGVEVASSLEQIRSLYTRSSNKRYTSKMCTAPSASFVGRGFNTTDRPWWGRNVLVYGADISHGGNAPVDATYADDLGGEKHMSPFLC